MNEKTHLCCFFRIIIIIVIISFITITVTTTCIIINCIIDFVVNLVVQFNLDISPSVELFYWLVAFFGTQSSAMISLIAFWRRLPRTLPSKLTWISQSRVFLKMMQFTTRTDVPMFTTLISIRTICRNSSTE